MPRFRRLLALLPTPSDRRTAERLTPSARLASLALLVLAASAAEARGQSPSDTPLHLAASRFEFVASGDQAPMPKPLRVHNGGTAGFTDVRLVRLTYLDSARGAGWLIAQPRQSAVAPDELATVGTLCVDATGLPAGTYHATAAVAAREVPEPVAIAITLVVRDAAADARPAGARPASARCASAATK